MKPSISSFFHHSPKLTLNTRLYSKKEEKKMKIFNWVNRKFHRNINVVPSSLHKDEYSFTDQRSTIEKIVAADKRALLGQVELVDVLGGWEDGILTIGTLGFDESLKSYHYNYNEIEEVHDEEEEEDHHEERKDDKSENDHEGEHYPLVLRSFRDSFKEEICFDMNPFVEVTDCERPWKKNGERTTLADLFSADSEDGKQEPGGHPSEVLPKTKPSSGQQADAGKKQALRGTKNGISFAKKLIPRVGDDSRPIKKLNQLMTKMLKRKIHPELVGKTSPKSDGLGGNEEVSLLQTQVVVI